MEAFGSICFSMTQNPKKLDNRSGKGVFEGYDRGSPSYLVYFPEHQVVKKVTCVKFLKNQLPHGESGYVVLSSDQVFGKHETDETKEKNLVWPTASHVKLGVNYGSNGKKALHSHAKKKDHCSAHKALKISQSLPTTLTATKSLETCVEEQSPLSSIPYGASPSIVHFFKKTVTPSAPLNPPEPVAVNLADRKSHQEGMICSFIAEHDLPLSLAPALVSLAQELSKDPKALNDLKLERSSATYKLKSGVHLVVRKRLLDKMRNGPFSLNIDESTSKASKKRVLNILVCYFDDITGESVTDHYSSIEMFTVNAETVYQAITNQLQVNGIPFENLISILSDSAAYMRGKNNGVLEKMKEDAPHLVDIGGDTCHTIHNAVKNFCEQYDNEKFLPRFLDDIYKDFHFSADLREELKIISEALGLPSLTPLERISHRWLSIYDTTERLHEILRPLSLFYFAFLTKDDQTLYQEICMNIMKQLPAEKREKIFGSLKQLKSKSTRLTPAGKERKKRIVKALFYQRKALLLDINIMRSVLPMFKSFVLTFEQKCPLVHRLHDEMKEITRYFLASFLKVEEIPDNVQGLDVTDKNLHLPLHSIFTGQSAKDLLKSISNDDKKAFLQRLKSAYVTCRKHLVEKLPIQNTVLQALSSLDPIVQGHSVAKREMEKLVEYFPTVIQASDIDGIIAAIKSYHLCSKTNLPEFKNTDRLNLWWSQILAKFFKELTPLIKASLSIFTGPRVEQSFSAMNNIISSKSNRMDVSTYAAYQTVKYHLLNKEKSSTELFKRKDPIFSPVDKPLVHHIQTSWQRNRLIKPPSSKQPVAKKVQKTSAHDKKDAQQRAINFNSSASKSEISLNGAPAPKRLRMN